MQQLAINQMFSCRLVSMSIACLLTIPKLWATVMASRRELGNLLALSSKEDAGEGCRS